MSEEDDIILSELNDEDLVAQMFDDLYDGMRDEIEEGVNILIARGWMPYRVLTEALVGGMTIVGADFRDGILFVPEVLLAANAMKGGMAILKPLLAETGAPRVGKMIIGTVKGDIHDIGKNLVGMMMEGAGFEVVAILSLGRGVFDVIVAALITVGHGPGAVVVLHEYQIINPAARRLTCLWPTAALCSAQGTHTRQGVDVRHVAHQALDDVGCAFGRVVAIAKDIVGLPVAHIQNTRRDYGAVGIGICVDRKTVKRPADDRIRALVRHLVNHAGGCRVIMVIVAAPRMAAADIKLTRRDGIQIGLVGRQIRLRHLSASRVVIDWHAVHCDTKGGIASMRFCPAHGHQCDG